MYLDSLGLFSDQQDLAVAAGAHLSDNAIDLLGMGGASDPSGNTAQAKTADVGRGEEVQILIQVTESFNNLTSLAVMVQTDGAVDGNGDLSSGNDVLGTGAIAAASLVAGYQFPLLEVPRGLAERYMQLEYTIVGTTPTTGKITAGIVSDIQANDYGEP